MATTVSMTPNPVFETINGLTNTTFDPDDITSGRMITEDNILQTWHEINALKSRIDACCRDLLIWEARVQIVQMHTNRLSNDFANSGGNVISSFEDNVNAGCLRRGRTYTVRFPVKWDDALYVKRNIDAAGLSNCSYSGANLLSRRLHVNYRVVEDDYIGVAASCASGSGYKGFWITVASGSAYTNPKLVNGALINANNVWTNFLYEVADDGEVRITDMRGTTDFTVIRFYTQWMLRRCADGSEFTDP